MKNIRLIEIELFSYCNRKCKWCPNNFIDRFSNIEYLDTTILEKLIQELKDCNYSGYISFSRYNEPMSQIDYFKEKVKYIKEQLPECTLVTNTNGDFITKENLDGLLIDELTIMDYDNKGAEYCLQKLLDIGVNIERIDGGRYIYGTYNDMKILYYVNWKEYGTINDRGGSLSDYSSLTRNFRCLEPKYFVGVNYDGTISPCCNIRNDIDSHKNYILGDLHNNTLTEILNTTRRFNFINDCINVRFLEIDPCYYCQNTGGRYTRKKGGIMYD